MRFLKSEPTDEYSLVNRSFETDFPKYAILSHTWGADNEEVVYEDLLGGGGRTKVGYQKIRFCGQQATADGLDLFWVDSCCIDKSNSTELTEAINSMFRWYQNATRCYVYLADVTEAEDGWEDAFRASRYFTRS